jgi:hypothetical protein
VFEYVTVNELISKTIWEKEGRGGGEGNPPGFIFVSYVASNSGSIV